MTTHTVQIAVDSFPRGSFNDTFIAGILDTLKKWNRVQLERVEPHDLAQPSNKGILLHLCFSSARSAREDEAEMRATIESANAAAQKLALSPSHVKRIIVVGGNKPAVDMRSWTQNAAGTAVVGPIISHQGFVVSASSSSGLSALTASVEEALKRFVPDAFSRPTYSMQSSSWYSDNDRGRYGQTSQPQHYPQSMDVGGRDEGSFFGRLFKSSPKPDMAPPVDARGEQLVAKLTRIDEKEVSLLAELSRLRKKRSEYLAAYKRGNH